MFYEEKIIDNVLHWRGGPEAEYLPMTATQLTAKYVKLAKETLEQVNNMPCLKPVIFALHKHHCNNALHWEHEE